jgi:hypothetical protein
MNKPGPSINIEYITLDGSQWTARLEQVKQTSVLGFLPIPNSIIDPDFIHTQAQPPNATHSDVWIAYITMDGTQWMSKCHSHFGGTAATPGGPAILATFTFEHFHAADPNHADHEDDGIVFKAWDGTVWLAKVPNVWVPPNGAVQPGFDLQQVK